MPAARPFSSRRVEDEHARAWGAASAGRDSAAPRDPAGPLPSFPQVPRRWPPVLEAGNQGHLATRDGADRVQGQEVPARVRRAWSQGNGISLAPGGGGGRAEEGGDGGGGVDAERARAGAPRGGVRAGPPALARLT